MGMLASNFEWANKIYLLSYKITQGYDTDFPFFSFLKMY